MPNTFKRNVVIAFGFSLLLLLLSSIASYISIQNLITSAERLDHTNNVISGLDQINIMLQEAESSPAADVLLAEAVGLLAIVGEAGLDRVRAPGERQIILDGESRLLRAVVRRGPPRRKFGESEDAEVLVAIDRIRNADSLIAPTPIDIRRERILIERIGADTQVIDHARTDDPVPAPAVKVPIEGR